MKKSSRWSCCEGDEESAGTVSTVEAAVRDVAADAADAVDSAVLVDAAVQVDVVDSAMPWQSMLLSTRHANVAFDTAVTFGEAVEVTGVVDSVTVDAHAQADASVHERLVALEVHELGWQPSCRGPATSIIILPFVICVPNALYVCYRTRTPPSWVC